VRDHLLDRFAIVLYATQFAGDGSAVAYHQRRPRHAMLQRSLPRPLAEETVPWPPSCCWPPVAPDVVNCPRSRSSIPWFFLVFWEGGPARGVEGQPSSELYAVRVARGPMRPCGRRTTA